MAGSCSDDEQLAMCWLCQKSDIDVTQRYHQAFLFHPACLNAVKARHRQFRKTAGGVASLTDGLIRPDIAEMAAQPLKWRPKVLPYLENDKAGKANVRKSASVDAANFLEKAQVKGEVEHDDDVVITKKRFKKHRRDEVGSDLESEALSEEFEALNAAQNNKYAHKTGVKRVRCADLNGRIRTYNGWEEREGLSEAVMVDDVQKSLLKGNLKRLKSIHNLLAETTTQLGENATTLVGSDPKEIDPSVDGLNSTASEGGSQRGLPSSASRRQALGGGAAAGRGLPGPAPIAGGAIAAGAADPADDPKKQKAKKMPGAGAAFAVHKDDLCSAITSLQSSLKSRSPASLHSQLQKAMQELSQRQGSEADCPHASSELLARVNTLWSACHELLGKVGKCTQTNNELPEYGKAHEDIQRQTNTLAANIKSQIDAIKYRTMSAINDARAEYQKAYWKQHKIAQHFVEGAFHPALAKLLSEQIVKSCDKLHDPSNQVSHPEALLMCAPFADFAGDKPAVWER